MKSKLQELKIKSAKNKIISNYSYLDIENIYSYLDKEYMAFYEAFNKLNFNIETFHFNDEAKIDNTKFEQQHINAINLFIKKIYNFNQANSIYITIGFNSIGFWVKIDTNSFKCNLQRFVKDYGTDFYFYALKNYGLRIYKAEYEWEVLSTF